VIRDNFPEFAMNAYQYTKLVVLVVFSLIALTLITSPKLVGKWRAEMDATYYGEMVKTNTFNGE